MSPLTAAFSSASVPVTTIDELPLVVFWSNVKLLVVNSVRMPSVADSVSVSEVLPANESVNVMAVPLAVEKTRGEFSLTEIAEGRVIVGATKGLTVMATLPGPLRPSPGSESESCSEAEPLVPVGGV